MRQQRSRFWKKRKKSLQDQEGSKDMATVSRRNFGSVMYPVWSSPVFIQQWMLMIDDGCLSTVDWWAQSITLTPDQGVEVFGVPMISSVHDIRRMAIPQSGASPSRRYTATEMPKTWSEEIFKDGEILLGNCGRPNNQAKMFCSLDAIRCRSIFMNRYSDCRIHICRPIWISSDKTKKTGRSYCWRRRCPLERTSHHSAGLIFLKERAQADGGWNRFSDRNQ